MILFSANGTITIIIDYLEIKIILNQFVLGFVKHI